MEEKFKYDKLLQAVLDIGEEMLVCGAEVSRVEDSILRMCTSYGCDRVNVFIITSNIQVTLETPDGEIITHIRRVVRSSTNFDRLDYFNDLSRYVCSNTPTIEELIEKYNEVLGRKEPNKFLSYLGAMFIAGGFTVFFGGTLMDGLSAVIMGVCILLMENVLENNEKNMIVYFFVASLVAGIVAILTVDLGLGENLDKIIIGGIMLLIPGIALTNSIRDMLIGDLGSGLLRLVNALLQATSIACGFALSIIVFGGAL